MFFFSRKKVNQATLKCHWEKLTATSTFTFLIFSPTQNSWQSLTDLAITGATPKCLIKSLTLIARYLMSSFHPKSTFFSWWNQACTQTHTKTHIPRESKVAARFTEALLLIFIFHNINFLNSFVHKLIKTFLRMWIDSETCTLPWPHTYRFLSLREHEITCLLWKASYHSEGSNRCKAWGN